MARYTIQAPDGRKITVDAADEATAIRGAEEWVGANPTGTLPPAGTGANGAAMATGKKPVTLERLAEGIRRANAAGDIPAVRTLGAAYRKMQAEGGGAEQPKTVTLNVNGRKVSVDSKFLSLSKEEQDRTVDEIWSSISGNSGGVAQPAQTLEQVAAQLVAADAAGDTEKARQLAATYRQIQAQGNSQGPWTKYGNGQAPFKLTGKVQPKHEFTDLEMQIVGPDANWQQSTNVEWAPGQGPAASSSSPALAQVRQQYPQYGDLSDEQLADALYAKFYSDMPRAEFDQKIGLSTVLPPGPTAPPPAAPKSLADNLLGATAATANGIMSFPVIGPAITNFADAIGGTAAQIGTGDFGPILTPDKHANNTAYADYVRRARESREATNQEYPVANLAGAAAPMLAGFNAAAGVPLGARVLGLAGTLPERMAASALSTQAIGTADALMRGKKGTEAITDPLLMTGMSAAIPAVGSLIGKTGEVIANTVTGARQKALTDAALKNAPSSAELKTTAASMFKAVDQSGITADTTKFSGFVSDLVKKAKALRINPSLDPKATGAFQELIGALRDVQTSGGSLALSDLHTLRQIAQRAAISTEGRDSMFSNMIVNGLDQFITKASNLKMAPGKAGTNAGGNDLIKAISTWGRAKRTGIIEDAIARAQNAASGFENGLRTEFRKLLNSSSTKDLWSAAERAEIEKVVKGSGLANLTKLAGMFGFNFGSGSANIAGGSLGLLFGGPVGALAGAGARKASEVLTSRAANRAARVVATPNIPTAPPMLNPLLPMQRPFEAIGKGAALTGLSALLGN